MIDRVWNWLQRRPAGLRKFVLIVFGAGIALGVGGLLVLVGYITWSNGTIYERTGYLPPDQVLDIKNSVNARSDEEVAKIAGAVVGLAMDSARSAQDSMFAAISKDVIEPGIKELKANSKDIKEVKRVLGMNTDRITEQTAVTASATWSIDAMKSAMDDKADEQTDLLRQVLSELQVTRADNAQIKKKLKIADPYETR